MVTTYTDPTLKAQQTYVQTMEGRGMRGGLALGDAFIRGMRDIGYNDTSTALNELNDNSIQASAQNVHIILDGQSQPAAIAIWDDGVGMIPEMIRYSAMWGGTHRENDRSGFGRYGYGLPSASFSQGKRISIYSKVKGGQLYKVTVDIDEMSAGKPEYFEDNMLVIPTPVPATAPPAFVKTYLEKHNLRWESGTLVLWEKLDRLTWKTAVNLKRNLLQQIGITYRNFLEKSVDIYVDGQVADRVDPLFITPGARHYKDGNVLAEPHPPTSFEVKVTVDGTEQKGIVRLRYSYLPLNFAVDGQKGARFAIMKQHQGIIVCRNGRQIDVVNSGCPWGTFTNNDRYWNVEIDYDAILDDEFAITTSKQRIIISPRMWDLLEKEGVLNAIRHFRNRYKQESAVIREAKTAGKDDKEGKRASERVMEDVQRIAGSPSPTRQQRGAEQLQERVHQQAKQEKRSEADVATELEEKNQNRKYRVERESLPGAPFFRVAQLGGQTVLYLNTAHAFFQALYAGPESTPLVQSSLEILLFILGESELDATDDKAYWYQWERSTWSRKLEIAFGKLEGVMPEPDDTDPD